MPQFIVIIILLLFPAIGKTGYTPSPAAAKEAADFATYQRCKKRLNSRDYTKQYDFGKFASRAWQTVLAQKSWTPKERINFDPSKSYTRYDMVQSAKIAMMMWRDKIDKTPFEDDPCLTGEFTIFNKAWSPAHSGFTDYLSPKLKSLYYSLPER